VEGGEEVKCYCLEGDSFSFFCFLAPLDSASDPLGVCLTNKLILPAYRSTMLTACVFVTRDTVVIRDALCSENLFLNRIVHDPANFHSTNYSTITLIYHLGLYNRPAVAAVPGDVSPTPLIIILIIICQTEISPSCGGQTEGHGSHGLWMLYEYFSGIKVSSFLTL
jgi:hypothetical protein